ncbi:hypothetical protein NFI96_024862 [Prochilodus magdalenae]|nr:hypothetical protein NFI96_024862 [Prochilodus magdalenae]
MLENRNDSDTDFSSLRRAALSWTAVTKLSLIWICSTALLTGWVLTQGLDTHWTTSETYHNCNWTCMILTLQWPGSFCLTLESKNICKIPENIRNWTIHGLWSWSLNSLNYGHHWLKQGATSVSGNVSLRRDEWFKHGTCAACVESMGSPSDYFRTSLKLRMLFDIDNALTKADIKPSCNISYKHEDLHAALGPFLGDNYVLQCVTDEKKDQEILVQLKIRLSKNITLGCLKEEKEHILRVPKTSNISLGHPCPKNSTFFYFPIDYEHPTQPCI